MNRPCARRGGRFSLALAALFLAGVGTAGAQERLVLEERFDGNLDAWERIKLDRRQTAYATTISGGERILVATSRNAAAGFFRRFETPPPARATLEWRWRVHESLADNDRERERKGDDYVARVFVLFGDEPFERGNRALSYVWAGREPVGARYRNPVVEDVATIVVRSGDASAGRWVGEQRNVVADFRDAFGEPASAITGIAVVVDTDDTGSEAIAWFDDFVLEVRPVTGGS